MLSKILKYDFKYVNRTLIPLYLIVVGLCCLTRGLTIWAESFKLLEIISFFTNLLGLIAIVGLLFFTIFVCFMRFYQSIFKDEGYLTLVLPVPRAKILLAKLITMLVYSFITVMVIFGSLCIMYYSLELQANIKQIVDLFKEVLIPGLLLIYAQYANYFMIFMAAYALGQLRVKNKGSMAVLAGISIYMIMQVINLLVLFILTSVKSNFLELIDKQDLPAIRLLLYTILGVNIFFIISNYLIANYALNKKLDLE